ncbi:MAG: gfo/Idh/MocA family oxidoreductase, partial [Acidobacteriota bacterium]
AMNFPLATLPGLARGERERCEGPPGAPPRVELVLPISQGPRSLHDAGPWLAGRDEGGFVREVFSHFAELTQRYLGPLELVQARVEHDDPERTETRVEASFRAGEVPVSLLGGVGGAAPDFNRWTLFAEERSYRVEDWSQVSWSDGSSWEAMPLQPDESPGLDAQLDQLAALLRGEPSLLPTLRDGLTVQRAIEAVLAT